MIRHTVDFRLRHPASSAEEKAFLSEARILAEIPGVQNFQQLAQISPKNDFRFSFSMEFADEGAYAAYNAHPVHTAFVAERWVPEVEAFLEADYIALEATAR